MFQKIYKQVSFILAFCLLVTWASSGITVIYAGEITDEGQGITYHVSSTQGDDTNDGLSPGKPWKTLEKVNSMTFEPGTNILFKRGDHWNGDLYINDSGAPGQMIVYGPYGEGTDRPVINGTGIPNKDKDGKRLWRSGSAAILVSNVEYIRIEGLGVTNMGVDKEGNPNKAEDLASGKNEKLRSGIAVVQVRSQEDKVLNKIEIVDNEIYHVKGVSLRELHETEDGSEDGNMYNNAGIFLFIEGENHLGITRIDDLLIENNYIHDTSCMGIHTQPEYGGGGYNSNPSSYNTNVRIVDNQIARTGADAIIVGYTDKVLVERNVGYDAGATSTGKRVRVIAGIWPYNSYDSVFQYNECARTRFDRGDGMAWDSDWGTAGELIYQYNYSHENQGGTLMDCNTTDTHNWIHRYNLSVNEPGVQWTITAHEKGKIEFYNNTVYIAPGGGRLKIYAPHVPEIRMYNNIFVADEGDYSEFSEKNNSFVNNIVVGHEGPSFGKNTIISDPNFYDVTAAEVEKTLNNVVYLTKPGALDGWDKIKGWQLTSESPAINRGLPVEHNPKIPNKLQAQQDIIGNPITGAGFDGQLDIGAFEFQGEYTGDGKVDIAPMLATHGVEVEFATNMDEGIQANNLDGVNYELANIKNGDTITFDQVNFDQNVGIVITKANVVEDTTVEMTIGGSVVGEFTLEASQDYKEFKVQLDEEVVKGIYSVQLTFKGESSNELMKLDNFRLIPGRQGVVEVPYKYTFENGIEGWRAVSEGKVDIDNGRLKLTSGGIYTSSIAPEVTDGIVEAEITAGPNQRSTLLFRYDEFTGKYIEIGFDAGNYWFIDNEVGTLHKKIHGPQVVNGQTYAIKIKYQGSHVQVFVDGEEALNHTFESIVPTSGVVGVRKWQNNPSYITYLDNIRLNSGAISGKVTLKDTKEPMAGVPVSIENTSYVVYTDEKGAYRFDTLLLDQEYTVVVEKTNQIADVTFTNDEIIANFEIDKLYVNKQELIKTVEQAKGLEEKLYTSESWVTLQIAVKEAEEAISMDEVTQEEVNVVLGNLQQAVASLHVKMKETPYKYTFDNSLEGWVSEYDNIQLKHHNGNLQVKSTSLTPRITRDPGSPVLGDAVIEYRVQPETKANGGEKRSSFVVKHNSETKNYVGIGFDVDDYWFVEVNGENYDGFINAPTVMDGDTYKVKVKTIGSRVSVWINNQLCFDEEIPGVSGLIGQPGIRTWNPTVVNYDDIKINFGNIKGRVIDQNNVPVEGVKVVLSNGQEIYTDALGTYIFDEVGLGHTYTITINDVSTSVHVSLDNDGYEVEDIILVEEVEDVLSVKLSGNEIVKSGEKIDLIVSLNGIVDPVYSQDITIAYDVTKFIFDNVKAIVPNQLIGQEEGIVHHEKLGSIRVLGVVVDMDGEAGSSAGLIGNPELFKVSFTVRETQENTSGSISIKADIGTVVDGTSNFVEVGTAQKTIQIIAKEGPEGDFNEDGKVDIADVVLLAYYYRVNLRDKNWDNKAKYYDIVRNGVIDINDIAYVARLISGGK